MHRVRWAIPRSRSAPAEYGEVMRKEPSENTGAPRSPPLRALTGYVQACDDRSPPVLVATAGPTLPARRLMAITLLSTSSSRQSVLAPGSGAPANADWLLLGAVAR
jgi:hypothetical protein